MVDRIGQQLGNYRLMRLLGHGGFAEVYLGEHILLGTTVAIKVLHTQVSQEEAAPFQQEARLLASLKHPHIIRVLDFGIEGQTPYLVMDYAPSTLRTRHTKGTKLPVPTVVGYIKQIAQALQYAHERKIIHRDIKPENMLISEYNEILLSDFGIALIAQSSRYQSTKDMVGTIAYMAPEQIEAHPRSASDQYSLGIVAYEWLCGTPPFHGSFTEIAIKHSVTPPPPLRDHLPTLSPHIEQVIARALAKQPEMRFDSVSAFARELEQASEDLMPTDRPYPLGPSSTLYNPSMPSDATKSSSVTVAVQASQPQKPVEIPITNTTQSELVTSLTTLVPQTPSVLPMPDKTATKPTVSRRTVLISAAGGGAIAAVGAGIFVISHEQPRQGQLFFTYRGHSNPVNTVAWSPDGRRIASGSSDNRVQVWNANDGSNVFTYRGHSGSSSSSGVYTVAWSPDGKRIASGSSDNTVQVWDASDGSHVFTYQGHSSSVNAVAWSPDGKRIASGSSDNTVQVWIANDGSHVFTYRGHSYYVLTVAWSPDGKRIASGSSDGTVQVWKASDGGNVSTYRHSTTVNIVAWSPDGKWVASGSNDNTVHVWNTSQEFIYGVHAEAVKAVAWSPDGQRIVSGSTDKSVKVWNASDGSNVFTYRGYSFPVNAVAWSPEGKRIASGSDDRTVQVWQAV